jgi:hypothetical protein
MQKIVCKQGKCYDENSLRTRYASLYDKKNVIDQIESDLLESAM